MARLSNWENQIGTRLRLRDLHVLSTVAERGSMAKAAIKLGISQPAVSDVIANLEHALGVPLFERRRHGVEPTIYGHALLKRSLAAFDELKQGIRDIEFLSDPTTGELRIGIGHTGAAAVLPPIIQAFSLQYPRVQLQVDELPPASQDQSRLRFQSYDLVVGRLPPSAENYPEELNVQSLYDDPYVVTAGLQSQWARRRKIDLSELIEEPWTLPSPNTWTYRCVADACRALDLPMPKIRLVTDSMPLRTHLITHSSFLTALGESIAHKNGFKVLPVDLPRQEMPVVIITVKNRTLSPVAELFIKHALDSTRAMRAKPCARTPSQ